MRASLARMFGYRFIEVTPHERRSQTAAPGNPLWCGGITSCVLAEQSSSVVLPSPLSPDSISTGGTPVPPNPNP